jgi:hypothetical protein
MGRGSGADTGTYRVVDSSSYRTEDSSTYRAAENGTYRPVENGTHLAADAGTNGSQKRRGRGLHAAPTPERAKRSAGPRKAARTKAPSRTRRYMVLAGGPDDIVGVDQTTGAWTRLRVVWPADRPRLQPFELIDAELAEDPERDDMAHPEAVSVAAIPEIVGKTSKRSARRQLKALVAPTERNLLGFAGSAAPYWEFRGMRPSLALVTPALGPLLFRRQTDGTTWARFGWARSDNWLPVEDPKAIAGLWATQRPKLTGKDLAGALGFRPRYLLVALSPPRDGHCYKTVLAMLPRP